MSGLGLFIIWVALVALVRLRWFVFFIAPAFSLKKRRGKTFCSKFVSDRLGGAGFASATAGVPAAGATIGGPLPLPDRLPKHLSPVLVILKHVKAGAGW